MPVPPLPTQGTNSRRHKQPVSPPPASASFYTTRPSVTGEAQPPRGEHRIPVTELDTVKANGSTQALSSVKSASRVNSRNPDSHAEGRAPRDSRHTATSRPSVYRQNSEPRDGLRRSHSDSTKDGRRSHQSSSQDSSLRSWTSQTSLSSEIRPRRSHERSSSDTSDIRKAIYGELDPSLQRRRSSDSRATRPGIFGTGQEQLTTRNSGQTDSSSSSTSHWADSTAIQHSGYPSTADTSLSRLNTDVPKWKPSQTQTEQSVSRLSKPLPDIPESPVSPPHPVSAGAENGKCSLPYMPPTSPPSAVWAATKALSDSKQSLHHRAISNAQLATTNSRQASTGISGNRLGYGSSSTLQSGPCSDLVDITQIASSLENVCEIFQKRDILSAKQAVKKLLRTIEDSKMSLLDELPEYVRNVHTITLAATSVDSRKAVFDDYCLEMKSGAAGNDLAHIFEFSTMLMRGLCADFALLLGECSRALYKYHADPAECANMAALEDAQCAMDEVTQAVHASLGSALQTARERTKAGDPRRSLGSNTGLGHASGTATRRQRSLSEPHYGPLDGSRDSVIQDLNLELRSAKAVFDSIAQNYLSTPNDAPLPLNTKYVTYSKPHDGRKKQMVAITVEELVRHFARNTDSTESDTITLMDAFFLFFRHYIKAEHLVDIMIKIFTEPMPRELERPDRIEDQRRWRAAQTSTKLGVVRLIAFWLEQYFLPLTDEVVLQKINYFTFEVVTKDMDLPRRAAWLISMHLCNAKGGQRDQKYPRFPSSFEKLLKDGERGRMEYKPTGFVHDVVDGLRHAELAKLDVKFFGNQKGGAQELARALTLLESEIIHVSMPISFFHHREEKPAATIVAMRTWSNALNLWTRECIQTLPTARERATTFNTFVAVMQHCFELRNYSSAYTILLALKAIQASERFGLTMSIVSLRNKEIIQEIDEYFGDPRHNFPLYRKDMATTAAPANPLFFLVGGDLAKVAAMKKSVEAEYRLEGLSKHKSWVFPQYLVRLQGIVRDLERCYALYGITVNERIKEWLKLEVKRLEGSSYDAITQSLDSIHHLDEKQSLLHRKLKPKHATAL
ncbi:hypothetical protein PHLGIDRAFT_444340 [Phlebiopsis gigantea 11061_1 CR5-6]|uniref:Ras-GEF domain-containing protein n=1 Tax=Phlebiopsis gigantea (strain 11061_1 CR5-6) TaxID=745531 RepID=A0A0C3NP21_PHLG1|nr:hypothetical protein PHLGIDRAFT_444340 [Phlebiopsis gigantea 11061_1 CR5-6]